MSEIKSPKNRVEEKKDITEKCETNKGTFTNKVSFNLELGCHIIEKSLFCEIVSPIVFQVDSDEHRLKIEECSLEKIYERCIIVVNEEGSTEITKTCFCNGKGFLDRNTDLPGMASYIFSKTAHIALSNFACFDGYGVASNCFDRSKGEMVSINETMNRLSGYTSFYIDLSDAIVSYFTLANSTGTPNGVEFNSGKYYSIKYSNFVRVLVFLKPGQSESSSGLVVATSKDTRLAASHIYFVDCYGRYFAQRNEASSISLSYIYCDEKLGTGNSYRFQGTLDIGPGIASCRIQKETRRNRSKEMSMMTVLYLFLINIF